MTPPSSPPSAAQAAAYGAAIETLAGIRAHPRYTPRRPNLLPQLTRAINDPDATAPSIAAILSQDTAMAGNLLRDANPVVYRRPAAANDGRARARGAARLWDHTLRSATLASNAAGAKNQDDRNVAQLLALLHGLGSVVVVQVVRDAWSRAGAGSPDLQTVVSLLETWSLRCARAISADWGLSERARTSLDTLADGTPDTDPVSLARAVQLGRALAAAAMPGLAAAEPKGAPEQA